MKVQLNIAHVLGFVAKERVTSLRVVYQLAVANSTGSINVASSAPALELLTRFVDGRTFFRMTEDYETKRGSRRL